MGHNQFGQIIFPDLNRISDNATICKKTKNKNWICKCNQYNHTATKLSEVDFYANQS